MDLLNNLRSLPDNTELVLRNLTSRLNEFDQETLRKNIERYGRPVARKTLQNAYA